MVGWIWIGSNPHLIRRHMNWIWNSSICRLDWIKNLQCTKLWIGYELIFNLRTPLTELTLNNQLLNNFLFSHNFYQLNWMTSTLLHVLYVGLLFRVGVANGTNFPCKAKIFIYSELIWLWIYGADGVSLSTIKLRIQIFPVIMNMSII